MKKVSFNNIPTVILCGGQGSRIRTFTEDIPKPMIPIGQRPILWHIMKIYASCGFKDFVLCLGYKSWNIKQYFLNYHLTTGDCSITLGRDPKVELLSEIDEANWKVTFAETGLCSMTGYRLWSVRKYLSKSDCFCLTYGDGLADIDLSALIKSHQESGLVGTITAVHCEGRYGEIVERGGKVTEFHEKPVKTAGRINGGFMVFDSKRVWKYFEDRTDLVLEREPLMRMFSDGQLGVYEHDGYWRCMDTFRDYEMLNEQWASGKVPWKNGW